MSSPKIKFLKYLLSTSNNDYINEMYKKFINKDDDLPNSWKNYFKGLEEKDQVQKKYIWCKMATKKKILKL